MLNLPELKQFVTYAECGTLSAAAEILHISQPTLTRTMKHVEESFGVPLFHRGKNRIELTETGQVAVEQARRLLSEATKSIQAVQSFEQSLHTIIVHACAPAPLWTLLPDLSRRFPENTITSQLSDIPEIIQNIRNQNADIGILPGAIQDPELFPELLCVPYVKENLFVCVPESHTLGDSDSLTFSQLNGFNCLLRDHIGFWTNLVKE
ncbi:MAG: LysR family transcriptional regulator, partial [Eubacteriales bacterium]|nr:LysR family transcriptional regulator [Eubacteriales bacterium]